MDEYEALQSPIADEETSPIFLQQLFCAEEFVLFALSARHVHSKKPPRLTARGLIESHYFIS
jgi:hypothetical protein